MKRGNFEAKLNVPLQGGNQGINEASFINRHANADNVQNDKNRFKMSVSARRQINRASPIATKKEFEETRSKFNKSSHYVSVGNRRGGEQILENKLAISKDEQNYYTNHKVFSNTSRMPGGN